MMSCLMTLQDGDMEATAEELENAREDLEDRLFGKMGTLMGQWGGLKSP